MSGMHVQLKRSILMAIFDVILFYNSQLNSVNK